MNWRLREEMVAYSVQQVGEGWRWRVYGPHGRVLCEGLKQTQAAAQGLAEVVFWGRADHRIAA